MSGGEKKGRAPAAVLAVLRAQAQRQRTELRAPGIMSVPGMMQRQRDVGMGTRGCGSVAHNNMDCRVPVEQPSVLIQLRCIFQYLHSAGDT